MTKGYCSFTDAEYMLLKVDGQGKDRSSVKAGKIWFGHKRELTNQHGRIPPQADGFLLLFLRERQIYER